MIKLEHVVLASPEQMEKDIPNHPGFKARTDGTIIGKSGGARPFNLDMHIPIVTKNNFSIDQNNKKASINVSVTAK